MAIPLTGSGTGVECVQAPDTRDLDPRALNLQFQAQVKVISMLKLKSANSMPRHPVRTPSTGFSEQPG
jgi:hypothetical protein